MIPDKLLLSVETGVELIAVGIKRDREVLCVLGGTAERARETAVTLRASLAPDARDPRTGEQMSKFVEPGADVEASSYEGVEVVRAEVTPVTTGFFFGAIARGSIVQMISER
jgi:hypothetical protein